MEFNNYKRQPGKRLAIKEIFEGYLDENKSPRVLKLNSGEKYYRLKLMGIVVNKFRKEALDFNEFQDKDENIEDLKKAASVYTSLELDDGTGVLSIRGWNEQSQILDEFNIGDLLEVSGKPREYQGIIYLQFENGTTIEDLHWLLYHELVMNKRKLDKNNQNLIDASNKTNNIIKGKEFLGTEEKKELGNFLEDNNLEIPEKILMIISDNSKDNGISLDEIKFNLKNISDEEIKDELINLLNEGSIYEPKPNLFKKL